MEQLTNFTILNLTGVELPDYLKPESEKWGYYTQNLAMIWSRLIQAMHTINKDDRTFSTGFFLDLDPDKVTTYTENSIYGRTFYISPTLPVEQKDLDDILLSVNFKKRFRLNDRSLLIALAVKAYWDSVNPANEYAWAALFDRVWYSRTVLNTCFVYENSKKGKHKAAVKRRLTGVHSDKSPTVRVDRIQKERAYESTRAKGARAKKTAKKAAKIPTGGGK